MNRFRDFKNLDQLAQMINYVRLDSITIFPAAFGATFSKVVSNVLQPHQNLKMKRVCNLHKEEGIRRCHHSKIVLNYYITVS